MGQVLGSTKKEEPKENESLYMNTLEGNLDQIASDYILRQNFQDMKNLMEKDKCDELIILTTELVSKYFRGMDVTFLKDRFSDNAVEESNSVKFIRKKTMDQELKKESDEQLSLCVGIAKFYVQIAHLFAAITMTVNPKYTYTVGATSMTQVSSIQQLAPGITSTVPYKEYRTFQEQNIPGASAAGNSRTVGWRDKNKIPKDSEVTTSFHGICDNRIQILKNNNEYPLDKKDAIVTINPNICDIRPVQNLYQEPGIPELESLYRDKYDLATGRFTGMTDAMKKKYQEDLKLFYTAFTGEQIMPDSVTKFQDIPIMQYQDRVGCLKKSAQFEFGYVFQGGNVRMGDNGEVMFFGKDGTDNGEVLSEAQGFTIPFKVVRMSGVGKPGYKITLWGAREKQMNGKYFEPSVTFTNGFSGMYRNPQRGSLQDKLFLKYAEKLRNMINTTKKNKETLLRILEEIFEKTKDGPNAIPVVKVSKSLNNEKLKTITNTTRETIVSMYLSCERDFVDLLSVFDAIIDRQILAEAQSTQEELKQMTYRYQSNIADIEDQAATKIQATMRGHSVRQQDGIVSEDIDDNNLESDVNSDDSMSVLSTLDSAPERSSSLPIQDSLSNATNVSIDLPTPPAAPESISQISNTRPMNPPPAVPYSRPNLIIRTDLDNLTSSSANSIPSPAMSSASVIPSQMGSPVQRRTLEQ